MVNCPIKLGITLQDMVPLMHYDPGSGIIRSKVHRVNLYPGDVATSLSDGGYLSVSIAGKNISAHKVAWLLYYGSWPTMDIDHIDGNKENNAIANLREVTSSQNAMNSARPLGRAPMRGITIRESGAYRVHITANGAKLRIGQFGTFPEAMYARVMAERSKFGKYRRVGT